MYISRACYLLLCVGQLGGTRLLSPHNQSVPLVSCQPAPPKAWRDALSRLTEADKDIEARKCEEKLVLNLSGNNLYFEHSKYFATWLHVPGRDVHLHAFDLSNNCIFAAS